MESDETTNVNLDLYEVSMILALLKANETYTKSLEENLMKSFAKIK